MLEVKGRRSVVVPWAISGIVISLLGWWSFGGVPTFGKLWEIVALTLLFSGFVLIGFGIWKALDPRPVLVIDDAGFLDRVNMPARRFAWQDIKGFRLMDSGRRDVHSLCIDLVDPARFIASAHFTAAPALKLFDKTHGTPCVIPLKSLDVEPHHLLARLKSAQGERTPRQGSARPQSAR